ncbi:hypothetical protein [Kribbella sp. DT2]|uniref:hypothetical protein n=1 Tax=Kribbella sp. DT2 TaxID=3393427 RepID=UPI003CFAA328
MKWTAIAIGVLVAVFLILQLAGIGGQHGPGRHGSMSSSPETVAGSSTTGGGRL